MMDLIGIEAIPVMQFVMTIGKVDGVIWVCNSCYTQKILQTTDVTLVDSLVVIQPCYNKVEEVDVLLSINYIINYK